MNRYCYKYPPTVCVCICICVHVFVHVHECVYMCPFVYVSKLMIHPNLGTEITFSLCLCI